MKTLKLRSFIAERIGKVAASWSGLTASESDNARALEIIDEIIGEVKKEHPTCPSCKWFRAPNDCELLGVLIDDKFYCADHEEKESE